jgi:ribonuclease Y
LHLDAGALDSHSAAGAEMSQTLLNILENAALVLTGAGLCWLLLWWRKRTLRAIHTAEADSILDRARKDAELIVQDGKVAAAADALRLREETEKSFIARRTERAELEARLSERESLLNSQLRRVLDSEQSLKEEQEKLRLLTQSVEAQAAEWQDLSRQSREQLATVASLSEAEARELLLKKVEQDSLLQANSLSRQIVEQARAQAEGKARQIVTTAIQRYAGDHTFENTTATIALQSDEIKGRIIGREGRNIRAFEAATGVTVLIDDTPGAVLLSGFDPVRREVAKEAMQRLIQDGRIHPTRIEEVVQKVSADMEENITRLGEEAIAKAGVPPLHPEIVKLLGRLHFRHSYSQNLLSHSVEVAQLAGLMACELKLDVNQAKRAGLLHDIGKAVNHEVEGPHAVVGADLIKRYGECEAVANGVASHHDDVPPVGPLGPLVSAADAISASRPGARSESMTTYLKRIEDLEKVAVAVPGVEKAFALQAGRELRVFVHPTEINDEAAYALARHLAGKIENGMQYPGQIKVTVIRETRCVEVAK